MYVCICEGVTDKQLKEVIHEGDIRSCKELRACLGISSQCGKCNPELRAMLQCQSQSEPVACAAR